MTNLLLSLLLTWNLFASANEGELIVQIEGIKKVEGNIGLLVFTKDGGFPDQAQNAILELEIKVTSKNMEVNLGHLPYGEYAIALVHDVNANKALDKNLFGIPKEPFGFSNNKSIFFGLPDFEEAAVSFDSNQKATTIKLIDLY